MLRERGDERAADEPGRAENGGSHHVPPAR
jgi:hypothetical protein